MEDTRGYPDRWYITTTAVQTCHDKTDPHSSSSVARVKNITLNQKAPGSMMKGNLWENHAEEHDATECSNASESSGLFMGTSSAQMQNYSVFCITACFKGKGLRFRLHFCSRCTRSSRKVK